MFLATDALVVGLRALVFVALFQATGAAIFLRIFAGALSTPLEQPILRLARLSAWTALALTAAYLALSPSRFAGTFSGALDPSLVRLWLGSNAGIANIVRLVGLAMLAISLYRRSPFDTLLGTAGIALALVSFLLMGHTSVQPLRWLLAPLLFVHLAVVAGWFGGLLPLCWIARDAPGETRRAILVRFSALATWTVPLIFVCGLVIAAVLLGSFANLFTTYGAMIVAKTLGFAVLMALAALNKWRHVPTLAGGSSGAARAFIRTALGEAVLIAGIIMTTGVMTSLFSPEHMHA